MPSRTQLPVWIDPRLPWKVKRLPFGLPMRIWINSAFGAFQLRVIDPTMALPVTGMGFGLAAKDGPVEAHGALIEVTQVLPTKTLASGVARFRTSTPEVVEGWSTATCTPGFPTMKFFRRRFPAAPANSIIPFAFPTIMF